MHMTKNKRMLSIFILFSLCMIILLCLFLTKQRTFAAWIEEEDGKKYEKEDGETATGFLEINGKRYYFDEEGYLQTGKFYVKEEENYYYANKKGVVQTGVIDTKNRFYITDDAGRIQMGFVQYEDRRYYFNSKAEMETGWIKVDENWYYADDTGVVATGFITLDGYRYYLGEDGIRVSNAVMEIEGITYIFNQDGSVDENATALYPVYQYFTQMRNTYGVSAPVLNPKVQACAILRAAGLTGGYDTVTEGEISVETLLKNRGVKCSSGYEFSYGGIEGYGLEQLFMDIKRDINMDAVLKDASVTGVGLGFHQVDTISYYDIIFICEETDNP